MKIKKIVSVFLLLFALTTLAACSRNLERSYGLDNELPKDFMEYNSPVQTLTNDEYNQATILNGFESLMGIVNNEFVFTSKIVEGEQRLGLLSVFENRLLLDNLYVNIVLQTVNYNNQTTNKNVFARLFHVTDKNNRIGLYSSLEKDWVIPLDLYDYINYDVTTFNGIGAEVIQYKKVDETLKTERNYLKFDENNVITRETVPGFAPGEKVIDAVNYFTLRDPRLKEYKYRIVNNVLHGYKNDKNVFKTSLEKEANVTKGYVGKYLIVQTRSLLPIDAKKYSFYDGIDKYLLKTSLVDLTNGRVKEVKNFGYVLNSIGARVNSKNEDVYFISNANKIVDQTLLDVETLLFNDKMKLLTNLSNLEYSGFVNAGINKFYANRRVVNKQFEILLDLTNYDSVNYLANEELISLGKDGRFGVINLDGEIVIPFNYAQTFSFMNGYSYNIDIDSGDRVTVSNEGVVRKLTDDEFYLAFGLIAEVKDTGLKVKNYKGEELISLNNDYELSSTFNITSNIDGTRRGMIVRIRNKDTNEFTHYLIDK